MATHEILDLDIIKFFVKQGAPIRTQRTSLRFMCGRHQAVRRMAWTVLVTDRSQDLLCAPLQLPACEFAVEHIFSRSDLSELDAGTCMAGRRSGYHRFRFATSA